MAFIIASTAIQAVTGGVQAIMARNQMKEAERKELDARNEMERQKQVFANLDTSNPYLNMENTMEDLTVNQQQAEFQAQQTAQSQANILESMKGAAGGSGVAALAQAMANSGNLAAQQASSTIGQQEASNQQAERAEAGRLQGLERQGDLLSRSMQRDQTSTLLGMAQQETAAHRAEKQAAQQAMMEGISAVGTSISGGLGTMATNAMTLESAAIAADPSLASNYINTDNKSGGNLAGKLTPTELEQIPQAIRQKLGI